MRTFQLVAFEGKAPEGAIACDGLVRDAALDVSHWRGNRTPRELRADTSTEMALLLAREDRAEKRKLVVNNHFDTDGVLSVFALMHPEIAIEHADVIVAAAEVGDFDEWPADDRGLMLDAAIARIGALKSEARAYDAVLEALPTLVPSIVEREELWGEALGALYAERDRCKHDLVVSETGGIAVLHHRPGVSELRGPVLSRASPAHAKRWLLAFEHEDGTFDYRYELRRWSWADTTVRPHLPPPSRSALQAALGEGFAVKGDLGMSGLLRTTHPISTPPAEIARALLASDSFYRGGGTLPRAVPVSAPASPVSVATTPPQEIRSTWETVNRR